MSSTAIDTRKLQDEIAPVIVRARAIVVLTAPQRTAAMDFLRQVKTAQSTVMAFWKPLKEAAHTAWKKTTAAEAEFLKPLAAAEADLKRKVLDFDREQERIRMEAERKLQAEADAKAAAERERLLKKAESVKTEEKKEMYLEMAADVSALTVTLQPTFERSAGERKMTLWKAELFDLKALVQAAAGGDTTALSFLEFSESAAKAFARATQGSISVPGVKFSQETILGMGTK